MQHGELYWCDLGMPRRSEQADVRPVVILQADAVLNVWSTVIVIPLTSQRQWLRLPTCVAVPKGAGGLRDHSVALRHQTTVVHKARLRGRIGMIPAPIMREIEDTVILTLGLE
jgi:mRNA-degrading endonuclease toxin of MazEF toxin-antitoxin module